MLDSARRGELPGQVRTGATFADAAAGWLRFIEENRGRKPSTLVDYRSALNAHLLPAFGERPLEAIEPSDIEEWRRGLVGCPTALGTSCSSRCTASSAGPRSCGAWPPTRWRGWRSIR
ncbi:MAG: N-terminal phage integrase SAM-like domain-containing protein [Solirubrobacteraceae bacterium]